MKRTVKTANGLYEFSLDEIRDYCIWKFANDYEIDEGAATKIVDDYDLMETIWDNDKYSVGDYFTASELDDRKIGEGYDA